MARVARQLHQVSRDVERLLGSAMDPADAASRQHLDARQAHQGQRAGDSGRAVLAARDGDSDVAPAALPHASVYCERLQLGVAQADDRLPGHDPDCRRDGAALHGRPAPAPRDLQVARTGQAVRDQSRFECDTGGRRRGRPRDLGGTDGQRAALAESGRSVIVASPARDRGLAAHRRAPCWGAQPLQADEAEHGRDRSPEDRGRRRPSSQRLRRTRWWLLW